MWEMMPLKKTIDHQKNKKIQGLIELVMHEIIHFMEHNFSEAEFR
jgi:hypothetical protein